MRLYIAGPMRLRPQRNHPAFNEAEQRLRAAGYITFNPARVPHPEEREALAFELDWLCRHAEGVATLDGWQNSKGATAEVFAARAIGIPVRSVVRWENLACPNS